MHTGKTVFVALVTSMIASTAFYFGLRTLTQARGARYVQVPPLVGLTEAQARQLLEDKALELAVGEQREDERGLPGRVLSQMPAPGGELTKRGQVVVVLSKGPSRAAVPTLMGMNQALALQRVSLAGLQVGRIVRRPSDSAPKDTVIATTPASGAQLERGGLVNLEVSDGGRPVVVPRVVGLGLRKAKGALQAAGLSPGTVRFAFDEDKRGGVVLRQSPAADAAVARGTAVELVVNESE